jgi:hypothetical protein
MQYRLRNCSHANGGHGDGTAGRAAVHPKPYRPGRDGAPATRSPAHAGGALPARYATEFAKWCHPATGRCRFRNAGAGAAAGAKHHAGNPATQYAGRRPEGAASIGRQEHAMTARANREPAMQDPVTPRGPPRPQPPRPLPPEPGPEMPQPRPPGPDIQPPGPGPDRHSFSSLASTRGNPRRELRWGHWPPADKTSRLDQPQGGELWRTGTNG